jgi:hypothetical protein
MNRSNVHLLTHDRNQAFVVRYSVVNFFIAVDRRNRGRAEDKDKGVGGFNADFDRLPKIFRRFDPLPINPCISFFALKSI